MLGVCMLMYRVLFINLKNSVNQILNMCCFLIQCTYANWYSYEKLKKKFLTDLIVIDISTL